MKRLRDVLTPLANFFASGVLALGAKLGPLLWQLPPALAFDADRLAMFLALLPRSTVEAATLAQQHDERLEGRAWTSADVDRPLRHALEVRHPSYRDPTLIELLRAHGVALVIAGTAGTRPYREAKEEIGVLVKTDNLRLMHLMHHHTNSGRVALFFEAHDWLGEIVNRERDKCTGWVVY